MREIPKKNYVLVAVICFVTLICVTYFTYVIKKKQSVVIEPSVLSGYVLELGEKEIMTNLTNYTVDNPETILYVSYGNDKYLKKFEREFKELLKEYNLKSNFVFVNLNAMSNRNFLNELRERFFSDDLNNNYIKLERQSNMFLFKNGKIVKVLYYAAQRINIDDVKKFLLSEGIIKND